MDASDLPRILCGGRHYVLERFLFTRNPRTSWIVKQGLYLFDLGDHKVFWCCNICEKLFSALATSGPIKHLLKDHRIAEPRDDSEPPTKRPRTVLELQKRAAASSLPVVRPVAEQFKEALIDWVADANIAFSGVEHPKFRKMLWVLNAKATEELLPESGDTVKRWLQLRYNEELARLKQRLARSPYQVHISFDIWTSPQSFALMAVVAHYFDPSVHALQTQLLGLYRVIGNHSGENVGPILACCLQAFGIVD